MRMTSKIGGVCFKVFGCEFGVQEVCVPLSENRSPSCWWVPTSVAPAAMSTRKPFSIPCRAVCSSAALRVYVMTGVPSASESPNRMTSISATFLRQGGSRTRCTGIQENRFLQPSIFQKPIENGGLNQDYCPSCFPCS